MEIVIFRVGDSENYVEFVKSTKDFYVAKFSHLCDFESVRPSLVEMLNKFFNIIIDEDAEKELLVASLFEEKVLVTDYYFVIETEKINRECPFVNIDDLETLIQCGHDYRLQLLDDEWIDDDEWLDDEWIDEEYDALSEIDDEILLEEEYEMLSEIDDDDILLKIYDDFLLEE